MNSITTNASPETALEKRFVSSVVLAMLFIVVAVMFIVSALEISNAADFELNASSLLVLVWPALLFLLSWPSDGTLAENSAGHAPDSLASTVANPKISEAGEFFPPWLGSDAYKAAVREFRDERY